MTYKQLFNPLNAKLNPICHLLALLGAHNSLHVSRIWVKEIKILTLASLYILEATCFIKIILSILGAKTLMSISILENCM